MKHISSFNDFLNESQFVSPQEKERKLREAGTKLRENVQKIMVKIKEDPENADILRIELELANAKLTVFNLTERLKIEKERKKK